MFLFSYKRSKTQGYLDIEHILIWNKDNQRNEYLHMLCVKAILSKFNIDYQAPKQHCFSAVEYGTNYPNSMFYLNF